MRYTKEGRRGEYSRRADDRVPPSLTYRMTLAWIWLDWNGRACGGVGVDAGGVIRDAAPIFRRLIGQQFDALFCRGGYVAKTPLPAPEPQGQLSLDL